MSAIQGDFFRHSEGFYYNLDFQNFTNVSIARLQTTRLRKHAMNSKFLSLLSVSQVLKEKKWYRSLYIH
jgi:hypothetical protein